MVLAGISFGGHTDLYVLHGGNLTGVRYCYEISDAYVRPYAASIDYDFILMDNNAQTYRAVLVENYLQSQGLERME